MNICVFGDSVAKGVVFDETKNRYSFLKENFIALVQAATAVQFKNYAKFGCTASKGEEIMEKETGKLTEYSYTILEFGGNDCDMNWAAISESPDEIHDPQVPLDKFRECYVTMIRKTIEAGSHPILLSLPPLDPIRFFDWISKDLNRQNIMKFLGNDVNNIYKWHAAYNDMVFTLADEYGLPVVDIRKEFLDRINYSGLLSIDGMIHWIWNHNASGVFVEEMFCRHRARQAWNSARNHDIFCQP